MRLFSCFSAIFIIFCIKSTLADDICKCGGHYANNQPVQGCINDTCFANSTESIRCAIIRLPAKENSIIGYDCVPWPKEFPTSCTTFDDGSRMCINDSCSLFNTTSGKGCQNHTDPAHVFVGAQLTNEGIQFALEAVRELAGQQIRNLNVSVPSFREAGFNITISNITVKNFTTPNLTAVMEPPSTVKVLAAGGDFKVCAHWKAFWSLVSFISASGDLCVWSSDPKKGVSAEVEVKPSVTPDGHIHLETGMCKLDVPFQMESTGIIGSTAELVVTVIHGLIQRIINKELCNVIAKVVHDDVNKLLTQLPTLVKVDPKLGLNLDFAFQSVSIAEYGVQARLALNASLDSRNS